MWLVDPDLGHELFALVGEVLGVDQALVERDVQRLDLGPPAQGGVGRSNPLHWSDRAGQKGPPESETRQQKWQLAP